LPTDSQATALRPKRDVRAQQAALARERDALVAATAQALDPLRRRLFERLLGWAQRYGPNREQALFYMGAAWPTLRRLALILGQRLVQAGALQTDANVFYLETPELEAAIAARVAGQARPDLVLVARERRELREARKRLHPPPAVPPGHRMKIGPLDLSAWETQRRNTAAGAELHGFAVSPGWVTAPVSLIRSPADFAAMEPGTVLVCPTITPAWTPLFAQARGLVTDVGGILAHGSIVAREYGIPAVMGTGDATQRIAHGQVITVDGDQGVVYLGEREREGATSRQARRRVQLVLVLAAAGILALLIRQWRRHVQGGHRPRHRFFTPRQRYMPR
jgi:pyruvate,water dikinase